MGGGIIGCATAMALGKRYPNMKMALLEKEPKLGKLRNSLPIYLCCFMFYYIRTKLGARCFPVEVLNNKRKVQKMFRRFCKVALKQHKNTDKSIIHISLRLILIHCAVGMEPVTKWEHATVIFIAVEK